MLCFFMALKFDAASTKNDRVAAFHFHVLIEHGEKVSPEGMYNEQLKMSGLAQSLREKLAA